MPKVVTSYEVFDHGIENSQYFQGWSPPDGYEGGTGAGDNPHEAMEDALEMIAQGGDWELGTVVNDLPETPSVAEELQGQEQQCEECGGTGEIESEDDPSTLTCPECEGTGVRFADEDLNDTDMNYYVSVAVKGIDATLDGSWLTSQVIDLARAALETGDINAASVTADALEEAGCRNEELLAVLRDGDWEEVERVLRWLTGEYAMEGQYGTDYLSSNGMTFHQFQEQARKDYAETTGRGAMWDKMQAGKTGRDWDTQEETALAEENIALYEFIKERWPYPGSPERASEDYYASVGAP